MTTNIGMIDRGIRLVVGLALLGIAFGTSLLAPGWPTWVAIGAGAIMALTSVVGVCPAYLPFGIKTCSKA